MPPARSAGGIDRSDYVPDTCARGRGTQGRSPQLADKATFPIKADQADIRETRSQLNGRSLSFDPAAYKYRNTVWPCFDRLKQNRP